MVAKVTNRGRGNRHGQSRNVTGVERGRVGRGVCRQRVDGVRFVFQNPNHI